MRISSLGRGFGARVDGLALYEIGDHVLSTVLSLLEEWGLLVFPRQALDDRDLYAFATRIGSLEESSRKVCLSPRFPAIGNLSNLRDADGECIGFASTTTDFWHSDQQHRENPATLAFLYCLVPSAAGGATSFVSTDVDKTGLNADLVDRLAELRVAYEPASDHDNIPAVQVSHPALLKSLNSQRRFAYVSDNTVEFLGLGKEGSDVLKRQVLDHLLHPSRVYSHEWSTGDLVLYDNAQLMHRREPFQGRRWLKTAKIFAPKDKFTVPVGAIVEAKQSRSPELGKKNKGRAGGDQVVPVVSKQALTRVRRTVAESAHAMRGSGALQVPEPDVVRAGRVGGLPLDSITTDLYQGCLALDQTCYGSCFAARAAYQSGFDFGVRVENVIDRSILLADLSHLPARQLFLRNGWNSDASWNWPKALQLAEIVRETGRFVVFVTKCFTPIRVEEARGLVSVGAELRISISAFDTPSQLRQRFDALLAYQAAGGKAIPVVMTTVFADDELNDRQDSIVDWIVRHDLPGAENSLRVPTDLPVVGLLDKRHVRPLAESGDLWAGRLYLDTLPVPTTASLPGDYPGLPFSHLSGIDREWLETWRRDPVRTHEEVMSAARFAKPEQAGVAMNWQRLHGSMR